MKKLTVQDIAKFLNCDFIGDGNTEIRGFSSSDNSRSNCLTFLTKGYKLGLDFGAVLLNDEEFWKRPRDFKCYLIVDNPKLAFARVLREFYVKEKSCRYIDFNTIVDKTVIIEGTVYIGDNVKIQPYVTIGTEGFGHVRNEQGEWEEFPQIGEVVIGSNVEIAVGSNIHRGTLDNTIIGRGTKISTHCNIGHNSIIGNHVFIGGNTNLGGKTQIGDYSFIGMRVVTKPGIKIGKRVTIGMGSVVTKDIPDNVMAFGHPAIIMKRKQDEKG